MADPRQADFLRQSLKKAEAYPLFACLLATTRAQTGPEPQASNISANRSSALWSANELHHP